TKYQSQIIYRLLFYAGQLLLPFKPASVTAVFRSLAGGYALVFDICLAMSIIGLIINPHGLLSVLQRFVA
ncbi:MAG: hypothetical protein P8Z41_12215, partial [Anaerolineales bacterium]